MNTPGSKISQGQIRAKGPGERYQVPDSVKFQPLFSSPELMVDAETVVRKLEHG